MKPILYYLYNEVSSMNDEVLTTFYFKDIETEELVIINVTSNSDKYNKNNMGIYYKNVDEIKEHYDILWIEDDKYIYPTTESFDVMKKAYNILKLAKRKI